MATMKFQGLDQYVVVLERLTNNAGEYIGKTLYVGAGVVADAIKQEVMALPADDRPYSKDIIKNGPTSVQKKGLVDSFGITKVRVKGGTYDEKLGFDGYNNIRSKRWPKGQPNVMVARSIESGTSWMKKNPFIAKAVRASKVQAEIAMEKELDKQIELLMK